jgi:putative oxidoreductase
MEVAMAAQPRLLIPAFGAIYRTAAPVTEFLLRLVAGLSLVAHGYPKFLALSQTADYFETTGYSPGLFWAIAVGLTEVVGGLCLAAGFLTRLVSVPILIFLIAAIAYHSRFGFYWNLRGFEYPLFWSIVVFHFLIHGGGRWSVDHWLGREI